MKGNGIAARETDQLTASEYQQVKIYEEQRKRKEIIKQHSNNYVPERNIIRDRGSNAPLCGHFSLSIPMPRYKESDWHGRVNVSSYDRLAKNIAQAHKLDVDWLFGRSEEDPNVKKVLSDFTSMLKNYKVELELEKGTKNRIVVKIFNLKEVAITNEPQRNMIHDRGGGNASSSSTLTSRQEMYRADFSIKMRCPQDTRDEDPCGCGGDGGGPALGTMPPYNESDWQDRISKFEYDRLNRDVVQAYNSDLDCCNQFAGRINPVQRVLEKFNREHRRVSVKLEIAVAGTQNGYPIKHRIEVMIRPLD